MVKLRLLLTEVPVCQQVYAPWSFHSVLQPFSQFPGYPFPGIAQAPEVVSGEALLQRAFLFQVLLDQVQVAFQAGP